MTLPATPIRNQVLPCETGPSSVRFSRILAVPDGEDKLTIRCTLRWVSDGRVDWHVPRVEYIADPPCPSPDVSIAVVTGSHGGRPPVSNVQDNVDYYANLCVCVCRENDVDLIALP